MATFNEYILPIKTILQTNYIPVAFEDMNTNFVYVKDSFEDLINNFEIDITNIEIGKMTPINLINSKRIQIVHDSAVANYGFHLRESLDLSSIGYFRIAEISVGVLGTEMMVDNINLNGTITGVSGSISVQTLASTNTLTVGGLTTFNGLAKFEAGIKESYEGDLQVTLTNSGGICSGTLSLTKNTAKNLYLTIKVDTTVYTGGSFVGGITEMKVILDVAALYPSVDGQRFNIIVVDIIDSTDTHISTVLPVNLKLSAGLQQATSPATSISYTDGRSYCTLLPSAASAVNYKRVFSLQQILDNTITKLQVLNEYIAA